ncbi:hypothetical protein C8J57DRAFT_1722537 [Mycena rebaudengoi]|nr:hypothetical protein C8J57DRAFT_1722537 [Mycena rebaudengoi]
MTGGFGPLASSAPDGSRWKGHARVLGPSYTLLPTLTVGLLGLQIFWSVEMSYVSPYLLSLGLSPRTSLVFLAGPLPELVVQPLIGALADGSTSRWGHRSPAAATVTAWASSANERLTVALAVLTIFIIDFAANAVKATDRALLVDRPPPSGQAAGNACAALMLGTAQRSPTHATPLPARHLEALAPLVSLLLACHLVTALLVRERVLLGGSANNNPFLLTILRDIWSNTRTLPGVIRRITDARLLARDPHRASTARRWADIPSPCRVTRWCPSQPGRTARPWSFSVAAAGWGPDVLAPRTVVVGAFPLPSSTAGSAGRASTPCDGGRPVAMLVVLVAGVAFPLPPSTAGDWDALPLRVCVLSTAA